jgi:hypothetical protein
VTLAIGVGIGRLVFRALNATEVVLPLVLVVAMVGGYGRSALILSAIAVAALIAKLIMIRLGLQRRTAAVLRGDTQNRSRAHLGYVALELVKVMALLSAGVLLLTA